MVYEFINFSRDIIKIGMGFLNDYATLILVIITGIYAYFTYKMAKLMTMQVIADIQVSNVILGSSFIEDWFKKRVEKQPEQINRYYGYRFKLFFDVRNKNSGSGSIDKPTLILRFNNDNFEYQILPITKESWSEKIEESRGMTRGRTVENDLGGTIFLRGGESQKIELEYMLYNFQWGDDLLRHIKENLNTLEYYLKFSDNLEKNYLIKINNIKDEQEVARR